MLPNIGRDAVVGFRDAAADSCDCVAVSTDGDRIPDRILKAGRLKECHQRLRDRPLAGDVKTVIFSDAIQREVHGVIVLIDIIPYLKDAAAGPCHVDSNGRRLRTFHPFRVIVRYLGDFPRQEFCLLKAGGCETGRTDTHSRAITEAVIWLGIGGEHPPTELTTVSAVRIIPANPLHALHGILGEIAVVGLAHQNRLRQCQRHDAVIRGGAFICKEFKFLRFDVVPLKTGTDDIADNSS